MPSRTIVATAPVSRRWLRQLPALAARQVNFAPLTFDEAAAAPDWQVDHRRCPLPAERPGAPHEGGSFLEARDLLITYGFADPRRVRAIYDPATPFRGRDMLLVGRFLFLRFPMGVRVGGVVEGPATLDGRPVHHFRWHYRTLDGHLERGEMAYELVKWTDTGEVEFRIAAYSQRGPIRNPVVRLGFAVFARRTQLRFYDGVMARMQHLTRQRTAAR